MSTPDENCQEAVDYGENTPLHLMQYMQITLSLTSIVLVSYLLWKFLLRSIFDRVFKELLLALYGFVLIEAVFMFLLQALLTVVRVFASTPCEARVSCVLCFTLRIASSVPLSGLVWAHLSITIQRAYNTFVHDKRKGLVLGRLLIAISYAYGICINVYTYGRENYPGYVPYCSGGTAKSKDTYNFNLSFLFVLDIINLISDLLLLRYNRKMCKISASTDFDLKRKFHYQQNVYAIEEFLPCAVFHVMMYIAQILSILISLNLRPTMTDATFITVAAACNLMPYYCAFSPLILLLLMRRGRLQRRQKLHRVVACVPRSRERITYFDELDTSWDRALSRREAARREEAEAVAAALRQDSGLLCCRRGADSSVVPECTPGNTECPPSRASQRS